MGDIIAILDGGEVPYHVQSGRAYIITKDGDCISAGIPSEYYETARSLYEYIRSHANPGELSDNGIDVLVVGPGFGEGGGLKGITNQTLPVETVEEGTTIEELVKRYASAETSKELESSYEALKSYLEREATEKGLEGEEAEDYVSREIAEYASKQYPEESEPEEDDSDAEEETDASEEEAA